MKEYKDPKLAQFFKQHQQEIPDNGFSQKVMNQISTADRKIRMLQNLIAVFSIAVVVSTFITIIGAFPNIMTWFYTCTKTLNAMQIPKFSMEILRINLVQYSTIATVIIGLVYLGGFLWIRREC